MRSVRERQNPAFTKLKTGYGNSTPLEMSRVLQELICINRQIQQFHPLKLGAYLGSLTSKKTFPATWLLPYRKLSVLMTSILDFTNWLHSSFLCLPPSSCPNCWEDTKIQKSFAGKFLNKFNYVACETNKDAMSSSNKRDIVMSSYMLIPHISFWGQSFATNGPVQISNNFRRTKMSILIGDGIKRKNYSQSSR